MKKLLCATAIIAALSLASCTKYSQRSEVRGPAPDTAAPSGEESPVPAEAAPPGKGDHLEAREEPPPPEIAAHPTSK
jgi:hypothetical protein